MNAREFKANFKLLTSRILGWSEYMEVIYSASIPATALTLVELYERDQKTDKQTFQRYFKHITWKPNPQVSRLIGLALNDTNLGPVKCQDLIDEFGSVWNVLNASPQELAKVPGIGIGTAVQLLRKVGRGDV